MFERTNFISRRTAVKGLACSAASIMAPSATHTLHAQEPANKQVGIAKLQLRVPNGKIAELEQFYDQTLGLEVKRAVQLLKVTAGTTSIEFEETDEGVSPFYHVAFNIPENKLDLAHRWQREKTPILKRGSNEVVHFQKWNAHSVFFHDPVGNILEYIARHDLDNSSEGEFATAKDILYASEIGLVVDDVVKAAQTITDELGLPVYKGKSEFFAPLGDEHALLILVRRNRMWFPEMKQAAQVHQLGTKIRGMVSKKLDIEEYGYRLVLAE